MYFLEIPNIPNTRSSVDWAAYFFRLLLSMINFRCSAKRATDPQHLSALSEKARGSKLLQHDQGTKRAGLRVGGGV